MALDLADIALIFTQVSDSLATMGVLPYVLAGAVIGLVGRLIMAAKKAGR